MIENKPYKIYGAPSLLPILSVTDVQRSTDFYINIFGFYNQNYEQVQNGKLISNRVGTSEFSIKLLDKTAYGNDYKTPIDLDVLSPSRLYVYVPNLEEVYENCIANQASIVIPKQRAQWGDIIFECLDPDGYSIMFAQNDISFEA